MANKKRKCALHKEYYPVDQGRIVNTLFFCSLDSAIEYAKKKIPDTKKKLERERKRKIKQEKNEHNRQSLPWQHKQTQRVFNRMRVLEEKAWYVERGLEPECISCERKHLKFTCGHYKSVGHSKALRYDPKNTYLQCWWNCNKNKSGNIQGDDTDRGYIRGLYERFGDQQAKEILEYCDRDHPLPNWKWWELEEMREGFQKRVKELEKRYPDM